MKTDIITHYDLLIEENNDPVNDPKPLQEYMDKWDGPSFIDALRLDKSKSVLEIGLSVSKELTDEINYGTRIINVFPDTPETIKSQIKSSGLYLVNVIEVENAYIFVSEKR